MPFQRPVPGCTGGLWPKYWSCRDDCNRQPSVGNSARNIPPVDQFIATGDTALHSNSLGTGRSVLFLHAGVADSRMWNGQFAEKPGFQLIRFDMRGYGRSKLGSHPFTNHDDALFVLDHLGVERAIMVGCSIGANTALQLAAAAPERVEGLVLVGADAPGFDPGVEYQSPEWPEAIAAFGAGDLKRVAELDAEMWLAGVDRSVAELDPDAVELFVEMDLIALESESARDELDTTEPLEHLPQVDLPVRVIVGDRDIPQLRAAADHLARELSDSPAVVLADTAHLPSMDRPAAFNAVLDSFLGGI